MSYRRGQVVLAYYPFATGAGGSRRPVLVVQNDGDNLRMGNTIIAQITSTLDRSNEPTHLLIEVASPESRASGLLHDSVVSCNNLATIRQDRIQRLIGHLPAPLMRQVDDCLRVSLEL
jgi:mRNA interferase MazF